MERDDSGALVLPVYRRRYVNVAVRPYGQMAYRPKAIRHHARMESAWQDQAIRLRRRAGTANQNKDANASEELHIDSL
jgi:hypothetical protein